MSDQFDRAQELADLQVQSDLVAHQKRAAKAARLQPKGQCLNPACEELFLRFDRLFCDPNCEREYSRRATP